MSTLNLALVSIILTAAHVSVFSYQAGHPPCTETEPSLENKELRREALRAHDFQSFLEARLPLSWVTVVPFPHKLMTHDHGTHHTNTVVDGLASFGGRSSSETCEL